MTQQNYWKISFFAIDGDDIGNKLRDLIISNDIEGAKLFSHELTQYFNHIAEELETLGCTIIFCGGDSILATAEENIILQYIDSVPRPLFAFSGGIGETPEFAYLALQLAKARGKNQIVQLSNIANTVIKKF